MDMDEQGFGRLVGWGRERDHQGWNGFAGRNFGCRLFWRFIDGIIEIMNVDGV
jgi:hypothetical protein